MTRITCEYCNMEYDIDMDQCPLCGMRNPVFVPVHEEPESPPPAKQQPARKARAKRSAAKAPPAKDKIPRWIYVLISIFLGLAALIGSLYGMYAVGIIKFGKEKTPENASLDLPISENDTQTDPEPEPEPEPEPAEIACTGLSLKAEIVLTEVGGTADIGLHLEPENCTEELSLVSSNPAVCTADSNGQLTALSEGRAVITAVCGNQSATASVICDFNGTGSVDGLSLSSDDVTLLESGETFQLTVRGISDGTEVKWESDDQDVCSVNDGEVTARGPGSANVTAEVNGTKLTCTVRCRFEAEPDAPNGNTKNQLDHQDVTLKQGESFEISVVDGISGGWNVTDGSVITVDGNGIVTAVGRGTASVYTVVGGERLECIVRVN